ncbi:hypothetical protein F4779DRAFT_615541 [Xylariaceae sp. FL0662B]|nr:hypothetical protein F4779DRAFT_615541 [Xylariaceae sp. FL0662B]
MTYLSIYGITIVGYDSSKYPGHYVLTEDSQGPWVTPDDMSGLGAETSCIEDTLTRATEKFLEGLFMQGPGRTGEPETKPIASDPNKKVEELIGDAFRRVDQRKSSIPWVMELPSELDTRRDITADIRTVVRFLRTGIQVIPRFRLIGPRLRRYHTDGTGFFSSKGAYLATLEAFWRAYYLLQQWRHMMASQGEVIPLVVYLMNVSATNIVTYQNNSLSDDRNSGTEAMLPRSLKPSTYEPESYLDPGRETAASHVLDGDMKSAGFKIDSEYLEDEEQTEDSAVSGHGTADASENEDNGDPEDAQSEEPK